MVGNSNRSDSNGSDIVAGDLTMGAPEVSGAVGDSNMPDIVAGGPAMSAPEVSGAVFSNGPGRVTLQVRMSWRR